MAASEKELFLQRAGESVHEILSGRREGSGVAQKEGLSFEEVRQIFMAAAPIGQEAFFERVAVALSGYTSHLTEEETVAGLVRTRNRLISSVKRVGGEGFELDTSSPEVLLFQLLALSCIETAGLTPLKNEERERLFVLGVLAWQKVGFHPGVLIEKGQPWKTMFAVAQDLLPKVEAAPRTQTI